MAAGLAKTANAPIAPMASRRRRLLSYYWRRLLRLRASPHEIALGCAAGVFAAFTPFLGLQMLLAVLLALLFRVNVPAALLGTFAGNPLSWPAIWSASYIAGAWMLGNDPAVSAEYVSHSAEIIAAAASNPTPVAIDAAANTLAPHVKSLVTGSLFVGLIAATVCYYPTRRAVRHFQGHRRAASVAMA